MKTSLILILLIISLFLVSGCECPKMCDDNNVCTFDQCSKDTNYECVYEPITPCCGNKLIEQGENFNTCCVDAGCPELSSSCNNNVCTNPICDPCQYIENHQCFNATCCEDSDCNDNNISSIDKCNNPKTKSASCSNILTTECISGDNYCPTNCEYTEDNDCEVKVIDCGINFDCFIKASENCNKSEVIYSTDGYIPTLFGIEQKITYLYKLKGMDSGTCVFYLKLKENDIKYGEELVQNLLNQGKTLEEIHQQEQTGKEQAQLLVGRDGNCKINNLNNLKQFLIKTEEGTLSGGVSCHITLRESECTYSGDWEFFNDCEGSYFSTEL